MGSKLQFISKPRMRELFNSAILKKQKQENFGIVLLKDRHPRSVKGEPFCTHSQIIAYVKDNGDRVALAHRYLRPDGTIGASGKPDPKIVIWDSTQYELDPD